MPITRIEIRNVKGIQNKVIDQEILPNKPSILVAPNGYGKSSMAIAFKSLNSNRIRLNDDDLYENDEANRPSMEVRYKRSDNTILILQADDNGNTIVGEFDYFVINNQVRAKAVRVPGHGGATNVSASLHIDEMILINTIPENIGFGYSITEEREHFGENGKVLDNINSLFAKKAALEIIDDNLSALDRFGNVRFGNRLKQQVGAINTQAGTTAGIKAWAEANVLPQLDAENDLHTLANLLAPFFGGSSRLEIILSIVQISQLYLRDRSNFKAALARKCYECERDEYIEAFAAFNSTWKDIRPRQREGKLVVEFPKAHTISNGQRDVLCFVTLLEQARKKLRKQKSILIIDEVFDYLDDANLIVAQFYISNFISKFKGEGREIYPLILSHLDPNYFKSFLFSKLKIYYLDKRPSAINANMKALIISRENPLIEADVSKYLLHFDPGQINRAVDFATLNLHVPWATGNAFQSFVDGHVTNYLNHQPCDPFAICCGVRRKVEENIYHSMPAAADKNTFLNTHMTRAKLDFADAIGVNVPEYYYLLGIIYNSGMHWKNNFDNETPLITKLENRTIRQLISEVYS